MQVKPITPQDLRDKREIPPIVIEYYNSHLETSYEGKKLLIEIPPMAEEWVNKIIKEYRKAGWDVKVEEVSNKKKFISFQEHFNEGYS